MPAISTKDRNRRIAGRVRKARSTPAPLERELSRRAALAQEPTETSRHSTAIVGLIGSAEDLERMREAQLERMDVEHERAVVTQDIQRKGTAAELRELHQDFADSVMMPQDENEGSPTGPQAMQFMENKEKQDRLQRLSLDQYKLDLWEQSEEARPKATRDTYRPRQAEFTWFCSKQAEYSDGNLVSGDKILDFLRQGPISKGNRKKGPRQGQMHSMSVVRGYVTALVDLWQKQRVALPGRKINPYDHPRTIDVQNYLKLHERMLFHSKGGVLVKRRTNRAMRIYTLPQFEEIHERLFKAGGELDFRLRVDLLLGHFMLLRSRNRIEMELGDLSMLVQQFEGIRGPVNMLYALLQDVKAQDVEDNRYGYVFRHKEPLLCTVGAIAFYFWLRFDVNGETWPRFHDGDTWQSIRILKNSRRAQFEKLTYSAQLKACKSAYAGLGINAAHWTHISRTSGLQMAEQLDVPDAQLRLMGGWDYSKMVQHYSSKVARKGARMMAGQESERGRFYLSRESLDPPEDLRRMIFPHLDESIELVEGRSSNINMDDKVPDVVMAVFNWLRTVILQDAVVLSEQFPALPIWERRPFNTPQFEQFKQAALLRTATEQHPQHIQLQLAIPVIANQLQGIGQIMADQITHQQVTREMIQKITDNIDELNRRIVPMESFYKGNGYLKFVPEHDKDRDAVENRYNEAALICDNSVVPTIVPTPSESINTSNDPSRIMSTYEVSLIIESIEDAWKEWDLGLNDGPNGARKPSLRHLESTFKTKWRNTDAMRKRFSRRMLLINRIQIASQRLNISPVKAAQLMEGWRLWKGWRLDKVQKELELRGRLEKKGQSLMSLWGENDELLFKYETDELHDV